MTRTLAWLPLVLACSGQPDTDTGSTDSTFNITTDTDSEPTVPGGRDSGFVRILNLVTTEPAANMFIDGQAGAVLTGLPPLQGSVWRQIEDGDRTFRVGPTGGDEGSIWASLPLTVDVDGRYSLVILGKGKDIRLIGFEEDPNSVSEKQVRYSLLHAAPDLGPLDLWNLSDVGATTPWVSALAYGKGPRVLTLPKGSFQLGVDVEPDGKPDATYTIPDLGGRLSLPFYFVVDGADLVLVGQAPQGTVQTQRVDIGLPVSTGDTGAG